MSGIAKPLISSSSSTTPNEVIPAEEVIGMEPVNLPTVGTTGNPASPPVWSIVFALKSDGGPKTKSLAYTTQAARDAALTAARSLLSTNV